MNAFLVLNPSAEIASIITVTIMISEIAKICFLIRLQVVNMVSASGGGGDFAHPNYLKN